jgi:hypothetical protein
MALMDRTMVGPVERPAPVLLISAPTTPASAPNSPDSGTIRPRRCVHCRAATAGATTIALINTTPTVCRPTTMAATNRVVSSTSSARTGRPRLAAYSGSKLRSLNSFQNRPTPASVTAPSTAMAATSRVSRVAACPKRYLSSPACEASGSFCTNVSSISPKPKKTDSTRPSALSSLRRVLRVTPSITRVPAQPAAMAPSISTSGSLLRVSTKASTTPGRAACDMASPSRLCLRSTAKEPSAPLTMPSVADPSATVRRV